MKFAALALAAVLPALAGSPAADSGKVLGGLGAPITIEVYSSFACSHCRHFHDEVLPQLVRDYVVPGKVCVINRDMFPPNFTQALEAANYATAAARIGKYQEVADALFRTQQTWVANGKVWDAVAPVLTPDQQKKVQALARTPDVTGEVQHDLELGRAANVTNTPTLYITRGMRRYPYVGVPEYSLFRSLLDNLLK
jgi:protein-disulfide isomerase